MSTGLKPDVTQDVNSASDALPNLETLDEFAAWLYGSRSVVEVVALENAVIADVEMSVRDENGNFVQDKLSLDSGTWVLMRISDQPAPNAPGGIVVFEREETSGQSGAG